MTWGDQTKRAKENGRNRQRQWQIEQKEKGNCTRCGNKNDRQGRNLCTDCRDKNQKIQNKYRRMKRKLGL